MEKNSFPPNRNSNLLHDLMRDPRLDTVTHHLHKYRLQVIYTKIDRDAQNNPTFTDYHYNVDTNRYFYPASTVKLPAALLALEKLNDMNIKDLDKNTPMYTAELPGISPAVKFDVTAPGNAPSIGHYIKKIFLVSDNDAFNRLYEFVGQQRFNEGLWQKGYPGVQIRHRLDVALPPAANARTNEVYFIKDGKEIYRQPAQESHIVFTEKHDLIGLAYYNNKGELMKEPMDFALKNEINLVDLHSILRSIIFPGSVTSAQRFRLTDNDYRFLYQYMSQLPTETSVPKYDTKEFHHAYVKFLLFGGDSTANIPRGIRIFNKPGWAWGFISDVAYVVDFENKVEFLLSANLYVNENGILSGEHYQFDEVGKPFLKALGEIIYEYELHRTKKYQPDLSRYRVTYDQ
ncbi:beta-lactamase family protein [Chitinophaga skermanii]|uniref:Beta-lactamase family protein n=1 Tax=Chitinophaga skermanii TaxID=331697 RepID=A0A327QD81_9BACT|nr:serine hydrolase [Chitinophaga skermanii]RAJ02261.1 beta-lactamase family protein [Chitinophaga skermanii]